MASREFTSGYPSGLTASSFEAAIRFYWSPDAVAGEAEIAQLNATGLMIRNEAHRWELTARGIEFVRHLLATPLPVQTWKVQRHFPTPAEPK